MTEKIVAKSAKENSFGNVQKLGIHASALINVAQVKRNALQNVKEITSGPASQITLIVTVVLMSIVAQRATKRVVTNVANTPVDRNIFARWIV